MKVVISGSTGLIGRALARSLEADGHEVVGLSRTPGPGRIVWNPQADRLDASALAGVQAIVHLAGRSILTRWTRSARHEIWESRVRGARLLAVAAAGQERPPEVIITASGIGFYGDRGDEVLTEASGPGHGFLADLGAAWEAALDPARDAGIRVVAMRTAPVLRSLVAPMRIPFLLGLGARLGGGTQWMSWILLDDLVRAYRCAIEERALSGPVNAVAPGAVTNADFTRALAGELGRPAFLAVPAFALRLVLGRDLADEALLASQRVTPEKLVSRGFRFVGPDLRKALAQELGRGTR